MHAGMRWVNLPPLPVMALKPSCEEPSWTSPSARGLHFDWSHRLLDGGSPRRKTQMVDQHVHQDLGHASNLSLGHVHRMPLFCNRHGRACEWSPEVRSLPS